MYISEEFFELEKEKIDTDLLNNLSDSSGYVLLNYNYEPRRYTKLEEFVDIPYEKRVNNHTHPAEFQKLMQSEFSKLDFDLLIENRDVKNWSKYLEYVDVDWSWDKLTQLEGYTNLFYIKKNEKLVNDLILSKHNNKDIEELMSILKNRYENRLCNKLSSI